MPRRELPYAIIAIVADAVGNLSHHEIDTIFATNGAVGEPPVGSRVVKIKDWLKRTAADKNADVYHLIGKALEPVMDVDRVVWPQDASANEKTRAQVHAVLAKFGLTYHPGGKLSGGNVGAPTKSLEQLIRARDFTAVELEISRALSAVETDPPAGLTAACAIVESLLKIYIEDEELEMPGEQSIRPLWKVVQKHLKLDPGSVEDEDLRRILSGLASIVDGVSSLRTHASSAHGKGRKPFRVEGRHARLAIHAAHTLTTFLIEVWDLRTKEAAI
jgi:hypothetical protein